MLYGRVSGTDFPLRRLIAVPPLRYPLYAGLLVDEDRHEALEFSAAGMSLTRPMLEQAGLGHLRRGDECAVVLCVGGAGWEERYDVVLRLAALGDVVAGFAFVGLPPLARVVLERHEGGSASWDDASDEPIVGASAPFAFARLAEPPENSRRFILSISELVFALTQRRQASPVAEAPAVLNRRNRSHAAPTATPAGTTFVYGLAALALLCIVLMMVAG